MRDCAGWQPVSLIRTFKSPFLSTNAASGPALNVVWQVLRSRQTLTHLYIRRQGGPNHGPGGKSNDQKPPDHPHDALGYQKHKLGWDVAND
jgi:hypothetical protein